MRQLPNTPLKLLVVDDDPNTRELLSEALTVCGATVRVSATAGEAQQALATWRPDLVISDLGMPRIDGYELMRRVRHLPPEQGGTTPAIACTAYGGDDNRVRALNVGYDAVLEKPVNLDTLMDTIVHVAGVRGFRSAGVSGAPAADTPGCAAPAPSAAERPRSAPDSYARRRL